MASLSITTSIPPPWLTSKSTHHSRRIPSASLILRTGRSSVSVNVAGNNSSPSRPGLLHCSFVSSSLCSSAFHSAFSGQQKVFIFIAILLFFYSWVFFSWQNVDVVGLHWCFERIFGIESIFFIMLFYLLFLDWTE